MKNKVSTEVTYITCPKCKEMIYSRARHDFRWCSCKSVAIDGGFDYMKISWMGDCGANMTSGKHIVQHSKQEIIDDWRYGRDKLGKITKL